MKGINYYLYSHITRYLEIKYSQLDFHVQEPLCKGSIPAGMDGGMCESILKYMVGSS